MALLIYGETECPLCGDVIAEQDEVVAFPAFLGSKHRLNRFSDGVFHHDCFLACSERQKVESLYQRYRQIWESRPRDLKSAAEIDAWGKEAFKDFM